MRKALLPIFCCDMSVRNRRFLFSICSFGIPHRRKLLGGARYAVKNMDNILNEAFQATGTAKRIAEKKCDLESQYQLGTEAALRPHLRTLIIIRQGKDLVHLTAW